MLIFNLTALRALKEENKTFNYILFEPPTNGVKLKHGTNTLLIIITMNNHNQKWKSAAYFFFLTSWLFYAICEFPKIFWLIISDINSHSYRK